jgi:hypothetical protein
MIIFGNKLFLLEGVGKMTGLPGGEDRKSYW